MTKFEKPGVRDWCYPDMVKESVTKALGDAGIGYEEVEAAMCGYVYGDSTCGQRAIYEVGLTGIPVVNVNNNCSTGSTALYLAYNQIAGGLSDCVLAVGFEKMERGSLSSKYTDRTNPMDKHMETMCEHREFAPAPPAAQLFGNAGLEYLDNTPGATARHFARIAEKNHRHSAKNPYAQFRNVHTLEQIESSPPVYGPLTKLQCCPTSEGSGAAVLASDDFVRRHPALRSYAVEILDIAMATDQADAFKTCRSIVGLGMTARAAEKVYKKTGIKPSDVQVIELHDCFSTNEFLTYEALGLCPPGKAAELVDQDQVTYGGKWVVNPSGGLISKGHPLGATGLAQCAELCWQLRQQCADRQVPNATVALQHNIGLGGAVVVALYRLGFPGEFKPFPADQPNPAIDETAVIQRPKVIPSARL